MMYMLDTNIIIYFIKNRPPIVRNHLANLSESDTLCMSSATYAELLKGENGSQNPAQAAEKIANMVQRIPVVYPDAQTCEHYGKWAQKLKQQGTPIGNNNLWIAAHALSLDAILVTHNTHEFDRIDDLNWQDWKV